MLTRGINGDEAGQSPITAVGAPASAP